MTSALSIRNLSHCFGSRKALDAISLDVEPGQFAALLGINGAGKSTLFNLVTRLYDSRSGTIEVCGHDMRQAPKQALAKLGVVFQSRALDTNLTLAQNFVYQGALHGLTRAESLSRSEALLDKVRLSDRVGDKVRALSGGQVRRAEIARALLHGPELLLCDEATVGLDVQSRTEIVADVHAMASDQGVGVLWASHLIDEIQPSDEVIIIHQGRLLITGRADDISGGASLSDAFLFLTGRDA
ncbi:MAG: ABC transporter ATP-binding protein [Pseudomonadota bacterium]